MDTRELLDISVKCSIGWRRHDLEGTIMLAALVSKYGHNQAVCPRDLSGREGHFETIAREVDGNWHLEDTVYSFEVECYELDREVVCGEGRTRRGV